MTLGEAWDIWRLHYGRSTGNRPSDFGSLDLPFRQLWQAFMNDLLGGFKSEVLMKENVSLHSRLSGLRRERDAAISERDKAIADLEKVKKQYAAERLQRRPGRPTSQVGTYERIEFIRVPLDADDVMRSPGAGTPLPLSPSDEIEARQLEEIFERHERESE